MRSLKKLCTWFAVASLGLAALGTAHAQAYPGGPIKIIVPFTAGSATDIMARTVGERLSQAFG